MALERKDVEHVAKLARLELTAEELALYTRQLGDILKYVEKLDQADTAGVEPLVHAAGSGNVFREDQVQPSLGQAQALEQAPDADGVFFRVPKVIDTGEGA